MDILNNIPKSNLNHFINHSGNLKNKTKSKTVKWISIIAYLVIIIGSLFTF
ncbi:MAG: hypothetical protein IPH62_18330 [Ignavibacteriae bacterium]|nr:hypothetical protein [Ignavibacteriota bacterium]